MDGHFVPNITIGPPVVRALRKVTTAPLDCHLMIENPDQFIAEFADAGADWISVHQEACRHLDRTLHLIKSHSLLAGVVINPATPVEMLREILPFIATVNVMTVEPGFGGQKFIEQSPEKIRRVRAMAADVEIEVDGGIDARTAPLVVKAGATVLVAGSSVFGHKQGIAAGIRAIRGAVV